MTDLRHLVVAVSYTVGWFAASSGLILLNKYILSNLDFHYPLTLSRRVLRRPVAKRGRGAGRSAARLPPSLTATRSARVAAAARPSRLGGAP